MGQDFSREYRSTWGNPDVIKWKQTARTAVKSYYLGYEGIQWHEYANDELSLLTIKICFALFGQPTEVNDNLTKLEDAYTDSQKEAANKIRNKIVEVYSNSPATRLRVGIIFISCKELEKEFLLPIFRVYVGDSNRDLANFIDTNCRVYQNWTDWTKNNKLPMLKYCYPSRGFYTCSHANSYMFDPNQDPDIDFGTSPACDFTARVARQLDIFSGVTALATGGVAIVAMFTPLAPAVIIGSAISGTTAAVYGAGRSIDRLVDKGSHSESLADLESLTCWLSIILTPVHFATAATNSFLAAGARNSGRIFSNTVRTAATILNLTTVGLDSVMIAFGFANLIEKAKNNQLSSLDVLQFSMSVFFFGHTLIQPKTASGIIKAAQNEHISAYKNTMTDADARQSFQDFIDRNRGNGGIKDNSKIVRTINKINDPNAFFKGVGDMKADIGGRKGRTIILQDNNGQSHRVNPNRVFFNQSNRPPIDLTVLRADLLRGFGVEPDMVQVNNEYIFRNLTEHQKQRVKTVLGDTARNYNKNIIGTAKTLAQDLNCRTLDDFLCVVELVASEVKGKKEPDLITQLNHLKGNGKTDFIDGIQRDLTRATDIARNAKKAFDNPLKAVYHYRKHGSDFVTRLPDKIDFYLTKVPQKIFQDANLTGIRREPNGVTVKTYITQKAEFGVLVELPDNMQCIATLFRNPNALKTLTQKIAAAQANVFTLSMVGDVAQQFVVSMGLASILINVKVDNKPTVSLNDFARDQSDSEALQQMARILHAMTLDTDDQLSSE
ncbi:unnamed protein product [Adineta ricciae]|uniref:DUF4781 domain-containing protein n=1 Tax=Adineta ricciae TaxID=249248 RepID=A0A814Q2B9_ADIRI|nr:unnamed protein product [Adineta ricciae]CAF1331382.1 unnamed protein product [Adineta ricciae]